VGKPRRRRLRRTMLARCCAGLCGGVGGGGSEEWRGRAVAKPVLRLGGEDDAEAQLSAQQLIARFGLSHAPPGADLPTALVSNGFTNNASRLLVLLPSRGSALGAWDDDLASCGGGRGAAAPLLLWAEANDYAVALFSARALEDSPAEAWDGVLRGSPAKHVVALLARRGAAAALRAALLPVHPLLYRRVRVVCAHSWVENGGGIGAAAAPVAPAVSRREEEELDAHIRGATVRLPPEWADLAPHAMCLRLFELLLQREDSFQSRELSKYTGLSGLKETDLPGFRRVGLAQRLANLGRDRDNDELAHLCRAGEQRYGRRDDEDEEEPGID